MAIRIGIDVGGTFTDAVAVDNETFELLGAVKIPTTHKDDAGVAAGIIKALEKLLVDYHIGSDDVVFIAHGTTQATNALLEGDVEKVGVVGLGKGIEGLKVKADTVIDDILLAPNKYLKSESKFLSIDADENEFEDTAREFHEKDINVAVISSAYSVDDPSVELRAKELLSKNNILITCSHDISKLYGLKIRTRTAVINASILPKMVQTATMTQASVKKAGILAPLMIMRCDGGVMNVQEMKSRPILTMLSGPAAGVAGALMYEKISEGIFLEVGGTSTDISTIHNGQVMVSYAHVGGHKTYVNSLDVRTVGIAGGSMIRISKSGIEDVGPRSAHIAGLPYLVFTPPEEVNELRIVTIRPMGNDFDDYVVAEDIKTGKRYALTLTCAANASGFVGDNDYSRGYKDSAVKGFMALAAYLSMDMPQLLSDIHKKAAEKNKKVVLQMIEDYHLDPSQTVLIGGGGGAASVVPYLAKALHIKYRIAKNAEVISPIGVALAMVREEVERTIANPTEEDVLSIRREAEQRAIKSGAAEETIEITIEVDPRRSLVKAIATGASELRTGNRKRNSLNDEELIKICSESLSAEPNRVKILAKTDFYLAVGSEKKTKKLFGLLKSSQFPLRIIDREGVIRIQLSNGKVAETTAQNCLSTARDLIYKYTEYTEGGERVPEVFVCLGSKILNLAKLVNAEQITLLLEMELKGIPSYTPVILVIGSSLV